MANRLMMNIRVPRSGFKENRMCGGCSKHVTGLRSCRGLDAHGPYMPPRAMSLRVFAALPVPDEIAERVLPLMKGVPGAKWRPRENFHITLAFYGDLDETVIETLDAELGRITHAPFDLRLKGANHFGHDDPHALWLGVEENPSLAGLARRCRRAAHEAGVEMKRRVYTPHLTLAYLAPGSDAGRIAAFERRLNLYTSEAFTADRFHLYSSHGRKSGKPNAYEIEAVYPLTH